MQINNLNHIESANQTVVGGYYYYYRPTATAYADAYSLAVGYKTYSSTYTSTSAVAGLFSSSVSGSYASAR